jgi:hypothetical protein
MVPHVLFMTKWAISNFWPFAITSINADHLREILISVKTVRLVREGKCWICLCQGRAKCNTLVNMAMNQWVHKRRRNLLTG